MTEVSSLDGKEHVLPETEPSAQFARLFVVESDEVSPETKQIARKNQTVILQRLRNETATAVAGDLGLSDSSLSRWASTGPMALAALILARLGLKVVPADAVVFIKPEEFN